MKKYVVYSSILLAFVTIVSLAVVEEREWQSWANEHCEVFSKRTTTKTMFRSDGTMYVMPVNETGYRCDDGVEYWR